MRSDIDFTLAMWWNLLSEAEKERVVKRIIELLKEKRNIAILKPATFYAQKVNQMVKENTDGPSTIPLMIQRIAMNENDFYDGNNHIIE